MPLLRQSRRTAAVLCSAMFAACAADSINVPDPIAMEEQTWASALQVNLAQFTRLSSGVFFLDSLAGTGAALSGTPTVSVFYSVFLPNGTKVDERPSSGTPICFPLSGLIAGWQVGLQGTKVGGKRRLLVPPAYGYGAGANGPIPGNSNLLFNIQLVATDCTP